MDLDKSTELGRSRPRIVLGLTWGLWVESKPQSMGETERQRDRVKREKKGALHLLPTSCQPFSQTFMP